MAGWAEEALCAYLAGWIESDGSVGITTNGVKAKTYRLRVSLYNNNVTPLLFIQEHFGGTIHHRDRCDQRFALQRSYTLVWQAKRGAALLRRIAPYLIGKRAQAELAIAMDDENQRVGYNSHADRSYQRYYYEQAKALNSQYRGGVR